MPGKAYNKGMILDDIKNYAKQFDYVPLVENAGKLKKYKKFIVCGMGGSGIPGEILKNLADAMKLPVPVILVKDVIVPKLYIKNPLFVIISFSGETSETISALKSALNYKNKAGIAVITTGGKLEKKYFAKFKKPLIDIPNLILWAHNNFQQFLFYSNAIRRL